VDNDKKNFCSANNSKNKGAFLKSLNQGFMWITKRWVWTTIKFSTKIFFLDQKKRVFFECGKSPWKLWKTLNQECL